VKAKALSSYCAQIIEIRTASIGPQVTTRLPSSVRFTKQQVESAFPRHMYFPIWKHRLSSQSSEYGIQMLYRAAILNHKCLTQQERCFLHQYKSPFFRITLSGLKNKTTAFPSN